MEMIEACMKVGRLISPHGDFAAQREIVELNR
jgi:hypothetical protein